MNNMTHQYDSNGIWIASFRTPSKSKLTMEEERGMRLDAERAFNLESERRHRERVPEAPLGLPRLYYPYIAPLGSGSDNTLGTVRNTYSYGSGGRTAAGG